MSFDSSAATYDDTFGLSPVGRLFRFRLAERVMRQAAPGARVLDIGCGTGEDALWLSAQSLVVKGIDASPRMIEIAAAKAARAGSTATFECRSLENVSQGEARYDLVISNFGALNCVPLAQWVDIVPKLLTPTGHALVVLMGPKPLPESVRSGFAPADRKPTAGVRVGSELVSVHYESFHAVLDALRPSATVDRIEAMGCLMPGPGYVGFARRHPIVLQFLQMAEATVRCAPFFRGRGDHTLFEFHSR